jgi:hypothetical protein
LLILLPKTVDIFFVPSDGPLTGFVVSFAIALWMLMNDTQQLETQLEVMQFFIHHSSFIELSHVPEELKKMG